MAGNKISIILPTYNEKENIVRLIEELCRNIKNPLEVVVVDDDSPDLTWKVAEEMNNPQVNVIRRKDVRGLATAIERGIKDAKGEIVGWMDADMCMPPSLIPEMVKFMDDYDLVIGSRYIGGGKDNRGFFRVVTSRIINFYAGLLLGFDIKDYDSGFILMKKKIFEKVAFPSGGYGDYFIELVYKCKKSGCRLKEVPYIFKDREKGVSKTAGNVIGFLRLGLGYIFRITRLRFSS